MMTIVWDIDDVLNHLMQDWFEQEWRPAHPECRLSYAEIRENPPHRILGIEESEYLGSLDRFRLSEAARQMTPDARVVEWFAAHGRESRHMALTSRPLEMAGVAAEWVLRHFGAYIRAFGVVPCRSGAGTPHYDEQKSDFLAWWGKADLLVDDNRENIAAAAELGIRGVLFPQPWNGGGSVCDALTELTGLAHGQ
jgi:FMN phosphatase YigB (HAD superfamily)